MYQPDLEHAHKARSEAESKMLACVMQSPELFDVINPNIIRSTANIEIYRAMLSLKKNEESINPDSLGHILYDRTKSDKWFDVVEDMNGDCCPDSFQTYVTLVQKNELLDQIVDIASNGIKRVEAGEVEAIHAVANQLSQLKVGNKKQSFSLYEAMSSSLTAMNLARESGTIAGALSNIPDVDDAIGGFFETDFIVLAGRPSMGKTALASFMAYMTDASAGFISSEMQKESLSNRMVSMGTGISTELMRRPSMLSSDELNRMSDFINSEKMQEKKLYINDKGDITISEIESQAKEWSERYGIKVLFVDYIQRIKHDNSDLSDVARIGDVALRLKNIAKRHNICVVGLAQLNRDLEKRGGTSSRPTMSDLKGCGDIEQEADIIILLHRDSYATEKSNEPSIIELLIPKNRQGKIGICKLMFYPESISYLRIPKASEPIDF